MTNAPSEVAPETVPATLRQIIGFSSGFTSEEGRPSFLPYVTQACGKENPRILFIPTACGDADSAIVGFYETAARVICRPNYLSIVRQHRDMAERVEKADIIYVGGGNTRNLIALWRASGLDSLLREAWERGTVLCGQSAGAICWFDDAQTTSTGEPGPVQCLGFLAGSCSTHYDSNPARRPHLHAAVSGGIISAGFALADNTGLHFHGTRLHAAIKCEDNRTSYRVDRNAEGIAIETEIPLTLIDPAACGPCI
ncbi:MAG: Type 1 glutamine amidotransferase-like domain-containing protein [Candidatus Methylacidiphilales bacterium]|nr:peptidase E [Candidatus Methylacidiphilales bacterium]